LILRFFDQVHVILRIGIAQKSEDARLGDTVDLGLFAANQDIEVGRVVVIVLGARQKTRIALQPRQELGARVVNLFGIHAGNRKRVLPLVLVGRSGADLEHRERPQKRDHAGNRAERGHELGHFLLNRPALVGRFQKSKQDALVRSDELAEAGHFDGREHVGILQQDLIDAFRKQGHDITLEEPADISPEQTTFLVEARDKRDEIATCALWVKHELAAAKAQGQTCRLAVVVPGVSGERPEIERAFRQILAPAAVAIAASDAPLPYEFSLGVSLAVGLLFGLILFFAAPLLVHVVLGDAFQGSIPALRVFSLWIPLVALSTVMMFQLLLPNQLDYQFNVVILTAGLLGFVVLVLMAGLFANRNLAPHVGMGPTPSPVALATATSAFPSPLRSPRAPKRGEVPSVS